MDKPFTEATISHLKRATDFYFPKGCRNEYDGTGDAAVLLEFAVFMIRQAIAFTSTRSRIEVVSGATIVSGVRLWGEGLVDTTIPVELSPYAITVNGSVVSINTAEGPMALINALIAEIKPYF